MARTVKFLLAAATVLAAAAAPAQVHTYTQSELGYPVPLPIESQTPVAGFRSYASLTARLAALVLSHDHMTVQQSGTSLQGQTIRSYRFSSPGLLDSEGIAKSAVFIQGSIHAREWASPEVTMAIVEWLAEQQATDPLAAYILDHQEIVVHPITNPDGMLQTQRFPTQTYRNFADYDCRNRRKNMRNADNVLTTTSDAALGVDLNRNHPKGWANSSSSTSSDSYHGTAASSEPETLAAYAAENLLQAPTRLRLAMDIHSAIPGIYRNYNGSLTRNAAVTKGADLMYAAVFAETGVAMQLAGLDVNVDGTSGISGDAPIGATDEYFTDKYKCIAYTVELRTPQNANSNGVNDFILPAAEVNDLRRENMTATKAILYYTSGPAAVVGIDAYANVADVASGAALFAQTRPYANAARSASTTVSTGLQRGGSYLLAVRFNKPMRIFSANGTASLLPGMTGAVAPTVQLEGVGAATFLRWSRAGEPAATAPRRYEGDTAIYRIDVPTASTVGGHTLAVSAVDLVGVAIDGDPTTVADWSNTGWLRIDAGSDRLTSIPVTAAATQPAEGWLVW